MGRSFEQLDMVEKKCLVEQVLDKKQGASDKDWSEIVDEYQLECNPETLRKAGVGIKLAYDAQMNFDYSGSAVDRDRIDRMKMQDLRREINKELREQSRSELLRETIRDAILALPPLEVKERVLDDWYDPKERYTDLVVGLGDFHYGAEFTTVGLYGEELNRYNDKVFEERMNRLGKQIVSIAQKEHPGQITLMMVGDLLDGMLRQSPLMRLQYGLVESAMRLSEFLSQWIVSLANYAGVQVRVYSVRGNHGEVRPLGSKAGQFPEENMERVVMHYLYARLEKHPYITIEDDDCPMMRMVDVCGYQFMLTHGQGTNIESMAKDSVNLYHKPIDVFMVGHLHKGQTFASGIMDGTNIYVERVPSICGMDPYAQSRGYGGQPGATAILTERGYGRRCVYPIKL